MPKKIRELKAMLRQAGFSEQSGKRSHVNFWYRDVAGTFVTIARNDGDDAARYQEKQVARAIERARQAGKGGSQS